MALPREIPAAAFKPDASPLLTVNKSNSKTLWLSHPTYDIVSVEIPSMTLRPSTLEEADTVLFPNSRVFQTLIHPLVL